MVPGNTSVNLLSDGTIKMDGGAVFGQIPKGQWHLWMPADRRNRVKLGLNCLLVRLGDKNYLVDTGVGQHFSADRRDAYGLTTSHLLTSLRKSGIQPQDIHGVVLTSLHFEHAGNCTKVERRGEVMPTFPKAKYFVQRAAFEEAVNPTERDAEGYVSHDYMPVYEKGQMELLDEECLLAPGLSVRRTGGPSNGHQIVVINHGGDRVAFLGDLVPTRHHLQLGCIAASDRKPEETLEAKRRVLTEAMGEGWLLVFSHGVDDERAAYWEERNGRPRLRSAKLD